MSSRRKKRQNRVGRLCISLIVTMFLAVMSVQILKLYQKDQDYSAKELQLAEELEDEEKRQADLNAREGHIQSAEGVEELAKSRLGLVFPNQIVFKEDKQ